MHPTTSYISVTDQFCGAGGSSLGASLAGCEVVLAMNHWKLAIETHNTNFPDTTHVLTDIQRADPQTYPSTDILITSPECTNHSLAKGKVRKNQGQLSLFGDTLIDPAEERSRATMWDVPRFAEYHNYRCVIVENVIDARRWRLFDAWIHAMQLLDYDFEIVYFNSQFAPPTPQSRDRMYVVFWKKGNRKPDLRLRPAAWCEHCGEQVDAVQSWKSARQWGVYKRQYVYRCPRCAGEVQPGYYPAYTAIDWALPVERIGDRQRPLKPRTIERIEYGLKKYARCVTIPTDHVHAGAKRGWPVDYPLPTQTAQQTLGMAVPPFLMHYYTRTSAHSPVDEPVPTCTGDPRFALVCPPFLAVNYGGNHAKSVEETFGAITTVDHHALITPPFLTSVNYFDEHVRSVDEPMPTQTTAPKMGLTVPPFMVEFYGQSKTGEITEPLSTMLGEVHQGLVMPFLASYYGSDNTRPVTDAMGTVTSVDKHALVEPTDSLQVEDCGFRMIQPHEIQAAMAFPESYQVLGNKRDKVRQLGNAVTPPVMKLLVERCVASLEG